VAASEKEKITQEVSGFMDEPVEIRAIGSKLEV